MLELGANSCAIVEPDLAEWATTMTLLVQAEAYAVHRELLQDAPESFSPDVRARLELGREISGADYAWHRQRARRFRAEATELLTPGTVILLPTTATVAPLRENAELLTTTRQLTALTYPWSVVGAAGVAVPCGFSDEGLPISLQIVAGAGADETALTVAAAYQRETDWHLLLPPGPAAVSALGARV